MSSRVLLQHFWQLAANFESANWFGNASDRTIQAERDPGQA